MTAEAETIVRERLRALDAAQQPVTWSEIASHVELGGPEAVRIAGGRPPARDRVLLRPGIDRRTAGTAAAVAVVIGLLIVAPILLFSTGDDPPAGDSPEPSLPATPTALMPHVGLDIAGELMTAWVAGDGDGVAAVLGPDVSLGAFGSAELPALHDWYRELGWTFEDRGCSPHAPNHPEEGYVSCVYGFEHDVTRALGWDPLVDRLWIRVLQGRVVEAEFGFVHVAGQSELFTRFVSWVREQHGEAAYRAIARFAARVPRLDDESIALWRVYTDEFIASADELGRLVELYPEAEPRTRAAQTCAEATRVLLGSVGMGPAIDDLESRADWYEAAAGIAASATGEILAQLAIDTGPVSADLAARFAPDAEEFIQVLRDTAAALRSGSDTAALDRSYLDLRHRIDNYMYGCPIETGG